MGYEYDRIEREDGGGSFLMGLLAGTVLGACLGMLFSPKAGAEVRRQLSEQASRLRSTANETYNQASEKISQASEKVSQMVDRGREAYERAKSVPGSSSSSSTMGTGSTVGTGTTGYPTSGSR